MHMMHMLHAHAQVDVYYRAHRYVSTFFPWWNRTRGADHIWAISQDGGTCDQPWVRHTHNMYMCVCVCVCAHVRMSLTHL